MAVRTAVPLTELGRRLFLALAPGRPLGGRIRNIGHMLSGNAFATLFGLISLSLTMRSLGPAQYAVLALVISYGRVIERITRFESWQPLIKYAAGLGEHAPAPLLRQLYSFGFRLDASACAVAAICAAGLALVATPLLGMSAESVAAILIYSIALLFNVTGMPTAILRMAGRFKTIAYVQASGNLLRIGLCAVGLGHDAPLLYFVSVWVVCQVFNNLLLFAIALHTLRKSGVGNPLATSCTGVAERFPGIWKFAWSSNLSMTLRSSANDLDVLVVGWLADPVSAGLYYFAKRLAKAVQQINVQVQAVLYPDVARLWAQQSYRKFARATSQIQILLAAGFLLVLALLVSFGDLLIHYGPGDLYSGALPMLFVQILAVGITTHAAPSRTALLAMGRQASILQVVLVATLAFYAMLLLLVPVLGAMGANIAHVCLALICGICFDVILRRGIRTAKRQNRHGAAAVDQTLAAAE